jgi:hypothetical protein
LLIVVFALPGLASAQASGVGVGIRPAIIEDRLDPGAVTSYSIQLNNLSDEDQTFYLTKRDITGVQEGGVPIFGRLDGERSGFELSEWITLEQSEVFIPARGEASVGFVMNVPPSISPGGHFGGIMVSVEPPKLESSGAGIGYEVANIISIRISGEVNEMARIRQFTTSEYFYSQSEVDFFVDIENEGNTLIKPVGPLEIRNMLGRRVTQLNFNETGRGIFPFSTETLSMRWEGDGIGFGRYQAQLTLAYGDDTRKFIDSTLTFWILPLNIILPALGVLVTIILIIYVSVKLYIRRTMAMLSGGSTRRLSRSRGRAEFPTFLVFISMLAVSALFLIILLLIFA